MSLRRRLVAGLLLLAALGMVASAVATSIALNRFLLHRIDSQLADISGPTRRGIGPGGFAVDPNAGTGSGDTGSGGTGPGDNRFLRRSDLYFGVMLSDGTLLTRTNDLTDVLPAPKVTLSTVNTHATNPGETINPFNATGGSVHYRMIAVKTSTGDTLLFGLSLHDVRDTEHRLMLIEWLVGVSVLAALAALSLWAVRLGLRPLDRMASTADEIAEGDLSRRIEHADNKTEVGRLGHALNTMLSRIEEAFEARRASEDRLRRFAADASHELRTPLTSIRGYAELFRHGAADRPEDLAKAMSRIESEATRMGLLVDDLLLLTRLDQGRPLDLTSVDFSAVVRDSVNDALAVEPDRPIELTIADDVDGTPTPIVVLGDDARLRQVVANLLSNVRSHTPAGTSCRVSLSRRGEGNSAVAHLEVSDDGPGIAPDVVPVVFERFTRADKGRARADGGSGLGLSIVHAIVEAHGGTVGLQSRVGDGSTFLIDLPIAGPATLPPPPDPAAEPPAG